MADAMPACEPKVGTAGSWMAFGVRTWSVECLACQHRGTIRLDQFSPATPMEDINQRLVCTRCGSRLVYFAPDMPVVAQAQC